MLESVESKLLRIGVFYDGNFFFHVSNFYKYEHTRKARISIPGLHEFIRYQVAASEGVDFKFCHIVDAHFFRGRLSARDAEAQQKLMTDRVIDDILMSEGVVTHYLPLKGKGEKGIDVWLALEAFELAVYKRFDVLVLIAGDGDFVPLVRKVNSIGTRVMVLGWDFTFMDGFGNERKTITSIDLLEEVTYPVMMHSLIDDKTKRNDSQIRNLFVESKISNNAHLNPAGTATVSVSTNSAAGDEPDLTNQPDYNGNILSLKAGYGFIKAVEFPNNVFFNWGELTNIEFSNLEVGDKVTFKVVLNDKGGHVAKQVTHREC